MMTFSAWLIRKAASSALPGFHGRCSFEPPAPAAASSPPNPPAITLMKLRFIARHMMYDRIAPDEPTSAPVMIIAVLPSVEPIDAAAQPDSLWHIDPTSASYAAPTGIMKRNTKRKLEHETRTQTQWHQANGK